MDGEQINVKAIDILKSLSQPNDDKSLSNSEDRDKLLEQFRIITREKCLTESTLNQECLDLLVKFSRQGYVEAQKCLSNLILNYPHIRDGLSKTYVDCVQSRLNRYIDTAAVSHEGSEHDQSTDREKAGLSHEGIYYDLRILFLLSALCPPSRPGIAAKAFNLLLKLTNLEADNLTTANFSIVIECLKNLFNLSIDGNASTEAAGDVIIKLFSIIDSQVTSENIEEANDQKLKEDNLNSYDQLLVNLIHLLTNMPEEVYLRLSLKDADNIIQHLDKRLLAQPRGDDLDTILPILNACSNICKFNSDIRAKWFEDLLRSSSDFEKRPEEYDTLRGRLVRLMTSIDVRIKDIVAEFMYSLCGNDSEKLITYCGFGNVAAFLSSRGLLAPSRKPKSSSCDDPIYRELCEKIDPITGKLETPKTDPMAGMTDEQKEYHAHELATAITKLAKLGVVAPMKVNQDGKLTEMHPGDSVSKDDKDDETK